MNLLVPFGKIYGRMMDLRNRLYDSGTFKSYDLGARTISVGNLTTGGTGKTPLVALIARLLINDGETVCILTRGYGRANPKSRVLVSNGENILVDAAAGGDEPVELAMKLEGKAIIVADPDRVDAAIWAREKFGVSVFILDDGFQHRRARRDLDFVCIDATNPCGNGRILPAGTLRESFKSLKRADAIVVTRTDQVDDTTKLEGRLRNRNRKAPIVRASNKVSALVAIDKFHGGEHKPPADNESFFAFTAIGNPKSFFRSIEDSGRKVVATECFADHHRFTQADLVGIEGQAKSKGATALVTTAKDAVKLEKLDFELTCFVAIAETVIEDIDTFRGLVTSS